MTLLQIIRPPVVTGVTPSGWVTRRPGDVVISAVDAPTKVRYSADVAERLSGEPRNVLYPDPVHGPLLVSTHVAEHLRRYEAGGDT